MELVPAVLQSFTSSPSKADTSPRRAVGAQVQNMSDLEGVDCTTIERVLHERGCQSACSKCNKIIETPNFNICVLPQLLEDLNGSLCSTFVWKRRLTEKQRTRALIM